MSWHCADELTKLRVSRDKKNLKKKKIKSPLAWGTVAQDERFFRGRSVAVGNQSVNQRDDGILKSTCPQTASFLTGL